MVKYDSLSPSEKRRLKKKLFEEQGGNCPICNKRLTYNTCLDHDHKSGEVRGLLCYSCNTFLKGIEDRLSKEFLALEYLRTHSS